MGEFKTETMKARQIEWTYHAGTGIFYSNDDWDFKIYKTSLELHKGTECIDEFDTLEAAQQAAQDHADDAISGLIDPNYLLELTKFAMNEGYKNATVPMVYTAEEVLEKFKQKP